MLLKDLKSIAFIFFCTLSLLLTGGCSTNPIENTIEDLVDASDNDDDEFSPSFIAKINDIEFEASTLLSQSLTGAAVNIGDAGYNMVITGQYLSPDLKSAEVIILYVFGEDFDELAVDSEFNQLGNILGTQVPGAFAIYGGDPDADVEDDNFGTEVLEEISIKITAIDKENQLISGEFNFIGIDEDTNEKYEITDGVFTNLKYEIQ